MEELQYSNALADPCSQYTQPEILDGVISRCGGVEAFNNESLPELKLEEHLEWITQPESLTVRETIQAILSLEGGLQQWNSEMARKQRLVKAMRQFLERMGGRRLWMMSTRLQRIIGWRTPGSGGFQAELIRLTGLKAKQTASSQLAENLKLHLLFHSTTAASVDALTEHLEGVNPASIERSYNTPTLPNIVLLPLSFLHRLWNTRRVAENLGKSREEINFLLACVTYLERKTDHDALVSSGKQAHIAALYKQINDYYRPLADVGSIILDRNYELRKTYGRGEFQDKSLIQLGDHAAHFGNACAFAALYSQKPLGDPKRAFFLQHYGFSIEFIQAYGWAPLLVEASNHHYDIK